MLKSLMILVILTMMLMSMKRRSANWSQSISWHVIAVGKFNLTIIVMVLILTNDYIIITGIVDIFSCGLFCTDMFVCEQKL